MNPQDAATARRQAVKSTVLGGMGAGKKDFKEFKPKSLVDT